MKTGYDTTSVAITACSSVMGVIIPPSIMMVVWEARCPYLSVGFFWLCRARPDRHLHDGYCSHLCQGSQLPDLSTASPQGVPSGPRKIRFRLSNSGHYRQCDRGGLFTPTEASVVAVIYSAILGAIVYRTIAPKEFPGVLYNSARLVAISLFVSEPLPLLVCSPIFVSCACGLHLWIWHQYATTGFLIALSFRHCVAYRCHPRDYNSRHDPSPFAESVGMHPIHFAIIGVISLAFGLVTLPTAFAFSFLAHRERAAPKALKDVATLLLPCSSSSD